MRTIAFILILSDYAYSQSRETFLDATQLHGQTVGQYTDWLQSESPIEDVMGSEMSKAFTRGEHATINKNYTFGTYWYRVKIQNNRDTGLVYLHDPQSFYSLFQVYVNTEKVGDLDMTIPLQDRIVAIPLEEQGVTEVYIRKNTNGLIHQSNWSFWTDLQALKNHIHNSEKAFVALLTIYSMSLLITLLAYLSFREKIYLFYAGYLVSFVVFLVNTWSVIYVPFITEYGANATTIGGFFVCLYVLKFLDLEKESIIITRVIKAFAFGFATCFVIYSMNKAASMVVTSMISITIAFVATGYALVRYIRKKERHVLIFIVAYGTFLLSVVLQIFCWMVYNFLESNHILFYGMAAENIFMLMAMGNKIDQTVTEKLRFNRKMDHSYDQLAKVFYPHQLSLIESGGQLEESMPLGVGRACVICFDIASSSKIEGLNTQEFFRDVFSECGAIMNENYCVDNLMCNAFRIKEMGDGFICSVGYPFKSPHENIYQAAIELSDQFIAVFRNIVEQYDPDHPIYCSIGIAEGEVEAFYPKSKPMEYDLYGKGIILATRYEQMRKILLEKLDASGHMIIMQDSVFNHLEECEKSSYRKICLDSLNLKVRDHEGARYLYYRLVNDEALVLERGA